MANRFLGIFLAAFLIYSFSTVAALPNNLEARLPTPSKRYNEPIVAARAPAPSKRYAVRAPAPSKRYMEARAPAPSKRHVDARAPEPAPSKRHVNARAPEPAPSKRHVDARAPLPAPSKRAPNPAPSKRSEANQKRTVDQSIMAPSKVQNFGIEYCPKDHSACPVFSQPGNMPRTAAEWEDVSYECVDFEADLRSCGGCSSLDPVLHDCSLIPGAQGVSCVAGQCLVSSCRPGYTLRGDSQACFSSA